MGIFAKLFGSNDREIAKLGLLVDKINALEPGLAELTDSQLRAKTVEFKKRLTDGLNKHRPTLAPETINDEAVGQANETGFNPRISLEQRLLDELLPEAFATVREAAKRSIGQRHYDVQLIGGIALHQGKIAEMKTGEGKTLVATLPLYLNALLGQGAHLVTVNDFLAKYHAQWMGRIYHALGLTTGAIEHEKSWIFTPDAAKIDELTEEELAAGLIDPDWPHLRACTRKEAYAADVTYGTNNEFGFDYLRDNMVYQPSQMVQRGHRYAIVDEVDSILIDEARTPLIISAPAEESAGLYGQYSALAKQLEPDIDYKVDEKDKAVSITNQGIAKIEAATGIENFYDANNILLVHHLEAALKAEALFKRDKDYVLRDNEIVIVDEFTGRMMEGRRYSEGLHQAIEAKEGVEVKRESDTLATVTFQNLFRMYDKLSGMTGTAETEAEEFAKIYKLDVLVIPTNRPMIRVDQQDIIYKTEAAKYRAVVADIKARHQTGQPVLVGTISVTKNEMLAELLKKADIPYQLLNAKQHEQEAQIIAQAGRVGAVTVATNMAGRGVDIILGGMPTNQEEAVKVRQLGGLHVIGTERHESRRIDNQLRGRAGRQGDPGSSAFYVSMEDDLMRVFGGDQMRSIMERLHFPEDEPIQHKMMTNALEAAQRRVEGHNFDIRKHLVEYDDVMSKHRHIVYERRREILFNNPPADDWLHEQILEMLADDEKPGFEAQVRRFGLPVIKQLERGIYLQVIDRFWIDHLNAMQELREGIGLRGYGQRDPLVEYKHEAYNLFQRLMQAIDDEVVQILLKAELAPPTAPLESVAESRDLTYKGADESLAGGAISQPQLIDETPNRIADESPSSSEGGNVSVTVRTNSPESAQVTGGKVGRNEPCPCGSGKKYKKCHGS